VAGHQIRRKCGQLVILGCGADIQYDVVSDDIAYLAKTIAKCGKVKSIRDTVEHTDHRDPALMRRAVQGYSVDGNPIGSPGDQQGYFDFPGTGQMFSSARDLATLLAAELGELSIDPLLRDAMAMTQRSVFAVSTRSSQALAWEINDYGGLVIIDKPGGLNNASTYIGLVAGKKLGIVILVNRGEQYPHDAARERILPALAQ
jgi:beta-lactamase class C